MWGGSVVVTSNDEPQSPSSPHSPSSFRRLTSRVQTTSRAVQLGDGLGPAPPSVAFPSLRHANYMESLHLVSPRNIPQVVLAG